jgi:hypothetical protein
MMLTTGMVSLPLVAMFAAHVIAFAEESCGGGECMADETGLIQRGSSYINIHTVKEIPVTNTTANVPEFVSNSTCGAECACPSFEEVLATQKAWGDALVSISMTYETQGWAAAKAVAEQVIDSAYGYNMGPVLFNPTLTSGNQSEVFRVTREGALAYFVGNDTNFPADDGFALNGWRQVEFDNKAWFLDCNVAMTMGNVHITDKNGDVVTVDKTFGYRKDEDGALRIVLHHSGVPNECPA